MKRILVFLLSLVLGAALYAQAPVYQQDTIPAALDAKLDEYLRGIERLEFDQAQEELDFLISSVQEENLRNLVAEKAYNYFRSSKVMGSENLAVWLYDNWFANFKAIFSSLELLDEAEFYAFINRRSLIGQKAPDVCFENTKGKEVRLSQIPLQEVNLLYFYSTTCPKCLYTAHRLREILSKKYMRNLEKQLGKRLKINLFTVYTGDEDPEWRDYLKNHLNVPKSCKTKVYHFKGTESDGSFAGGADPTDYVTAYAVIQTPRLFMIDAQNVIIGRNLDAAAVEILLKNLPISAR